MKIASVRRKFAKLLRRRNAQRRVRHSAEVLLASGLFDVEYVSLIFGREFTSKIEAARHYVQHGAKKLLPFHPFIEPWYFRPKFHKYLMTGQIEQVLKYLDSEQSRNRAWNGFFLPQALAYPMAKLPAHQLIKQLTTLESFPQFKERPRVTISYETARNFLYESARIHQSHNSLKNPKIDWPEVQDRSRTPGLVSLIVLIPQDIDNLRKSVRTLRNTMIHCETHTVEIVLVDGSRDQTASRVLRQEARALSDFINHIVVDDDFSHAAFSNIGIANSNGEYIVITDLEHCGENNWLSPLMLDMSDENIAASQSLISAENETVEHAGYVFIDSSSFPVLLLYGLPLDDAHRHGGRNLHALSSISMLHRAHDAIAIEGFDTSIPGWLGDVDYSMRLAHGRELKVNTFSVFTDESVDARSVDAQTQPNSAEQFKDRWLDSLPSPRDAYQVMGLTSAHVVTDAYRPHVVVVREPREVEVPDWGRIPSLRWAIKSPAPRGVRGDLWGDTPFAEDLAAALRKLGQEVVVDRETAFHRESSHLDDVAIVLRGHVPFVAKHDEIVVSWVLYKPELLTGKDLSLSDVVYVASASWAKKMSAETEIPIRTLLQPTAGQWFAPDPYAQVNNDVIFVGSAYWERPRKIVADAISIGVDVKIWGQHWQRSVNERFIQADWIDREEAVKLYQSAGAVLNDHRDDSGQMGFINNRMFDLAASGARIVSDYVEGAQEIFGPQLKMYRTLDELKSILSPQGLATFPPQAELVKMAENIRQHHSFDARAATLVKDVIEIWNAKGRTKASIAR